MKVHLLVLAVATTITIGGCGASATTSSAGPDPTLAHFDAPGIAFDLPASWTVIRADVHLHYETVLGFVGNGTGAEVCPSDAQPGQFNTCETQIDLKPDSVVVKVSLWQSPTLTGNPVDQVVSSDPSATRLTVGGTPAAFETLPASVSGSDARLLWTLTTPGMSSGRLTLEASIRGPDVDSIRAQLDTLISTVRLTAPTR